MCVLILNPFPLACVYQFSNFLIPFFLHCLSLFIRHFHVSSSLDNLLHKKITCIFFDHYIFSCVFPMDLAIYGLEFCWTPRNPFFFTFLTEHVSVALRQTFNRWKKKFKASFVVTEQF